MRFFENLATSRAFVYYPLCLIIGAIGLLGHSPYFIWPVTIAMFACLFRMIVLAPTPRRAFWTGILVGTGYFMGQIYWISEAFAARGEAFIYLMPFMVGGLALLLSSPWGVMVWVFHRFVKNNRRPYLTLAGLLFLAEMIRGHLFGGFPWDLPAYIFKAGGPSSQSVSLFGVYGLSLLILVVAALLAKSLWEKQWALLVMALALLMANWSFGYVRLNNAQVQYVDNVRLRIVSAPFSQKQKIVDAQYAISVIQDHLNLTGAKGLDQITHVIWPEGIIDWDIRQMQDLRLAINQTFNAGGSSPIWIINNTRLDQKEDGTDYYNSTSVLSFENSPTGDIVTFADKKRLVPFGEIIPGGKFMERLGARVISEDIGSFTPAANKMITQVPGLPNGSMQICYEVIFSGLTPKSREDRANWILNQSNDAWFGSSVGPKQHANIASFRAIEEKVPVIRAASNGYSGIIDPYGRFSQTADPSKPQVIDVQLPRALGESFPLKWINLLLFLITLTLILIGRTSSDFSGESRKTKYR